MALLHCGNLTLEGKSSSAVATYVRVKELDLVFDLGRCPMNFIGIGNVFISHFHLDHYFGLPIYISQRWLSGIPPGNIYVPWSGSKQLMHILDRISALDTGRRLGVSNHASSDRRRDSVSAKFGSTHFAKRPQCPGCLLFDL